MWKTFPLPCPEPKTLTSRKMSVGAERAVTVSAITRGGAVSGGKELCL